MLLCQCGPKSEDCFQHLVEPSEDTVGEMGVCGAEAWCFCSSLLAKVSSVKILNPKLLLTRHQSL